MRIYFIFYNIALETQLDLLSVNTSTQPITEDDYLHFLISVCYSVT